MFFLRLLVAADIVSAVFLLVVRFGDDFRFTSNNKMLYQLRPYVIVQVVFFSLLPFARSLSRMLRRKFIQWMNEMSWKCILLVE